MTDPGSPVGDEDVYDLVDEALQGLELEPHETSRILGFANREIPRLQTPETSYFVLGSYREPYIRRLRTVENELNGRLGTYAFLLGDLPEIDIDRLPVFRIRFSLLAAYADHIVAVYEQECGGEVTELGKISATPYFEKSTVLPRDYAWMTDRNLDSTADVLAAAVTVYFNDDLDEEATEAELRSLVSRARRNGVDVSAETVVDRIEDRDEAVSYSWVHLNEFRLFELHDRCLPWSDPEELRAVTEQIP